MNPLKHLMKKDIIDFKTKKLYDDDIKDLPYYTIDIIFNHKNIWANL